MSTALIENDPYSTLFSDLVRSETRLYNAINDRLEADLHTSLGRYEILEHLSAHDGCRVHDIANEFAITIGAASKAMDRIEAAGYCSRLRDPNDRRSSHLLLTASGRQLAADARQVFNDEMHRRLDRVLTVDALRLLGESLRTLRRSLELDGTTGGAGRRIR